MKTGITAASAANFKVPSTKTAARQKIPDQNLVTGYLNASESAAVTTKPADCGLSAHRPGLFLQRAAARGRRSGSAALQEARGRSTAALGRSRRLRL